MLQFNLSRIGAGKNIHIIFYFILFNSMFFAIDIYFYFSSLFQYFFRLYFLFQLSNTDESIWKHPSFSLSLSLLRNRTHKTYKYNYIQFNLNHISTPLQSPHQIKLHSISFLFFIFIFWCCRALLPLKVFVSQFKESRVRESYNLQDIVYFVASNFQGGRNLQKQNRKNKKINK
jgi:hypothetical protein